MAHETWTNRYVDHTLNWSINTDALQGAFGWYQTMNKAESVMITVCPE